jgi:hypothetical protein
MRSADIGCVAAFAGLAALAALNSAMAQARAQENTIPDFSGLWERPPQAGGRAFGPPPSGPGPIMVVQDAGGVRAGDDTNPILRPHAAAAVKAHGDNLRAGGIALPAWSLCLPAGVPQILGLADPMQILQDPNYVVLMNRGDSQVRRVHMNGKASDDIEPSWYGYSVGHYEGPNTLVVDTRGQNDRAVVDRFGTPRSESIRVVERYTISPDRSEMRVDFMVEDPETFTTPWSANVVYREATEPFVEQICAENNKYPGGGLFPIPEDLTPDF